MNGKFQMQGGKNWIFPKDDCKPVLQGLSLAGNLVKSLLFLYGTDWRERGYGLSWIMPLTINELIFLPFS